jgi:hypothetical protein
MEDILRKISTMESISIDLSFNIANICSKLLRADSLSEQKKGRDIIINILDNWSKIELSTRELWTDLIESAGFYPYLEKEKEHLILYNTAGEIRKNYYHSKYQKNIFYHEEQKKLLEIIESGKNLIVSAPTSFGKSLLIEELVASKKYENMVIIQPTLALLDETRKKLNKYSNTHKIIIRTSQLPSVDKKNIFLFTAERVMEYSFLPKIDFLILDEFYKLSASRDDERSDILNNAFNLLVNKHNSKFYLLGPNIDNISEGFADRYNAIFYKTNYSLVQNKTVDYYKNYPNLFGERGSKKEFKEAKLFELLYTLKNEQTIIYCSSPSKVRRLSEKYYNYLVAKELHSDNLDIPLVEWIQKNVYRSWNLIKCLQQGIGIHDGALQKHITTSMIDYFNRGLLRYLFCTSTIIEGVNTSAKNVIFFDKTKGKRIPIDYFDYSNIKGRSGRMMIHYTGTMYNFNPAPPKKQIVIDIPFFEQNPISKEVLIHLDKKDVNDNNLDDYLEFEKMPSELRDIIKKNGTLVDGQLQIFKKIHNELDINYNLIRWTNYPTYEQLTYIINLAWTYLLKPTETTSPMTKKKLVKVTFDYGMNQSINTLITTTFQYKFKVNKDTLKSKIDILNESITETFQILKHWFGYKVPKWLNVINSIQEYVCKNKGYKPGNYSFYSRKIENDFIRDNMILLLEYGVPKSAINKLNNKIPETLSQDEVIAYIKKYDLAHHNSLISYESEKLNEVLPD